MPSPTERTLKALKEQKYDLIGIVERRVPNPALKWGSQTVDLFGFLDILCCDVKTKTILGVQSTGQDYAGHMRKMTEDCRDNLAAFLGAGGEVQLWAWRKIKHVKKDGKKGKGYRWKPRIAYFSLADDKILVQEEKRSFLA